MKKQNNTYQLTHASLKDGSYNMQLTGIFITASNYKEAGAEARRIESLHGKRYGIIRMEKNNK